MKKGRILLGEDNELGAMAIGNMLKDKIVRLDVARNPKDLMKKYQKYSYNFILLTTWFQDSLKITRRIRAKEANLNGKITPIIGLFAEWEIEDSAFMNEVYQEYYDAGMNELFPQPLTEEDIDKIIEKYLL